MHRHSQSITSLLFALFLGTLATTMGQFGLLAMPVLMVTQLLSGSSTPMESMPVWEKALGRMPDRGF